MSKDDYSFIRFLIYRFFLDCWVGWPRGLNIFTESLVKVQRWKQTQRRRLQQTVLSLWRQPAQLHIKHLVFFSRHVTKGIHQHSYRGTVISHFEFSTRFHLSPSIKTMIGGNMYYGIIELHFYPLWQWLQEREGWEMTSSSSFTETKAFVYNNVIWMSTQILALVFFLIAQRM